MSTHSTIRGQAAVSLSHQQTAGTSISLAEEPREMLGLERYDDVDVAGQRGSP